MAAPSDISARSTARPGDELDQLRLEFNKLVTNFRATLVKLDADATVTDTNYFALGGDTTSSGPALIQVMP